MQGFAVWHENQANKKKGGKAREKNRGMSQLKNTLYSTRNTDTDYVSTNHALMMNNAWYSTHCLEQFPQQQKKGQKRYKIQPGYVAPIFHY